MKNTITALLLLLLIALSSSTLTHALLTESQYPFHPPGPTDLRSPCPALNAAANHGILPRNGRDISLAVVGAAVLLAYNMTYETMLVVGEPSLKTSTTGNASTFHLSDLAQHEPQAVEHDASLSREDAFFGGNSALEFSWDAWGRTLANWGKDVDVIDFQTAAQELRARWQFSQSYNPTFNGTFAKRGALLQYGLMLSTFGGNTISGDGNATMIKYWFENERLPLHWGWQPSKVELTLEKNELLAGNIEAIWEGL